MSKNELITLRTAKQTACDKKTTAVCTVVPALTGDGWMVSQVVVGPDGQRGIECVTSEDDLLLLVACSSTSIILLAAAESIIYIMDRTSVSSLYRITTTLLVDSPCC